MTPTKQQDEMKRRREKPWNTCDYCGKFIAIADFESGAAVRTMISQDTAFSAEEFLNSCATCCYDQEINARVDAKMRGTLGI